MSPTDSGDTRLVTPAWCGAAPLGLVRVDVEVVIYIHALWSSSPAEPDGAVTTSYIRQPHSCETTLKLSHAETETEMISLNTQVTSQVSESRMCKVHGP